MSRDLKYRIRGIAQALKHRRYFDFYQLSHSLTDSAYCKGDDWYVEVAVRYARRFYGVEVWA